MKLNLGVFTHALSEKLSPKFLSSNPRQKKINHSHSGSFFSKISPPGRKWVERGVKTMVLNKSQLVCCYYGCLTTHRKSIHTMFHSWDIRPSSPIWSDLLRVSWVMVSISGPKIKWIEWSELSQWFSFQAFFFYKKKKRESAYFYSPFFSQIWAKMGFLPKLGPASS